MQSFHHNHPPCPQLTALLVILCGLLDPVPTHTQTRVVMFTVDRIPTADVGVHLLCVIGDEHSPKSKPYKNHRKRESGRVIDALSKYVFVYIFFVSEPNWMINTSK